MDQAVNELRFESHHANGRRRAGLALACLIAGLSTSAPALGAKPQWTSLPETPELPKAEWSGLAPVNGVRIWYAVFGRGEPVILLHGGLASSEYWGHLVRALEKDHQVIVMDSRGHGRSTRNDQPFGYALMATDVIALMDYLKTPKAAIIGWSDGGIIGLELAMKHPERVTKLFAFAANSDPSAVKDVEHDPVFGEYIERAAKEYAKLSPTPGRYKTFLDEISKMWATQPKYTAEQLHAITVPTWIVDGDHDEAIKRENTLFMADQIPQAGLLLLPGVSHFAFLQDPELFNEAAKQFLAHLRSR